ncbi:MAG TPA: cation diffusion facilitator family transporter [Polyangia bacterium]|nr:cation diffusion facilitator family transporter [Polyangia bacterium]
MRGPDPCEHDDATDDVVQRSRRRTQQVRTVFLVTLALNAVVAVSKAGYSYFSGSLALGADSLHSILDASSNVLALFSLHWAARPANSRHPYGLRKIEILGALGIGMLIVISLFEFASAAVMSLSGARRPPEINWAGFVVVLATMAINFVVTRYEHRKGHELGSHLLCADAKHTESDLYASGAVLLSFVAIRFGWAWADGLAALVLIVLVGRVAWLVFRDNVPILLDAAMLDPGKVIELARGVPGIQNIHHVRSRGIRSAIELDLHMAVAAEMSVAEAHLLASQIEQEVKQKFPEVSDVIIHVEPVTNQ